MIDVKKLRDILDYINNGLGEWQSINIIYCPNTLIEFKKAQMELEDMLIIPENH